MKKFRAVTKVTKVAPNTWDCDLECGHVKQLAIKTPSGHLPLIPRLLECPTCVQEVQDVRKNQS